MFSTTGLQFSIDGSIMELTIANVPNFVTVVVVYGLIYDVINSSYTTKTVGRFIKIKCTFCVRIRSRPDPTLSRNFNAGDEKNY